MNKNAVATSSLRSPASVAQAYFDAFGLGDMDAALALLADDVVWHVDGAVTVSTVGLMRGRDRVRRWLEDFPTNFAPRVFAIDRLFENGDEVIAVGRFRHTVIGTDRTVGSDLVIRLTVRDEQITRYQILEDSALLARAFDPADHWDEQHIRLNGVTYGYSDRGDGPTVLFAHGLFVDHSIFRAQAKALEGSRRCIALDMPGHGRSGYRQDGWTLDDIADDIALMIEEMSLGEISFVGQSQGGMIGIRFAARRPDLVSRLVLIGTSARAENPESMDGWHALRQTLTHGSASDRETAFIDMQARLNDRAWLTREPEQAAAERDVMLAHDRKGLALAIDAAVIARSDVRGLLKRITAPTLVLHGGTDLAMPAELSWEIASLIPGAEIITLAGVGHHPPSKRQIRLLPLWQIS